MIHPEFGEKVEKEKSSVDDTIVGRLQGATINDITSERVTIRGITTEVLKFETSHGTVWLFPESESSASLGGCVEEQYYEMFCEQED